LIDLIVHACFLLLQGNGFSFKVGCLESQSERYGMADFDWANPKRTKGRQGSNVPAEPSSLKLQTCSPCGVISSISGHRWPTRMLPLPSPFASAACVLDKVSTGFPSASVLRTSRFDAVNRS